MADMANRNPTLLSKLPTGFTLSATTQVAGRGRGTNVWIAPPGNLIMSTVINHPAHMAMQRPIQFIQYLAAVAVVEAIKSYGAGYEVLPVKLKWPNDICKWTGCQGIFAYTMDKPTDRSPLIQTPATQRSRPCRRPRGSRLAEFLLTASTARARTR